jgi:hypothetical protein
MVEIRRDQVRLRERRRVATGGLPAPVGHDPFDLALDALGEFLAATGKDLDAVVGEWIVRRGDDDARVVRGRPGQVGDGRRRRDARAGHDRAFAPRTVGELRLDPRP